MAVGSSATFSARTIDPTPRHCEERSDAATCTSSPPRPGLLRCREAAVYPERRRRRRRRARNDGERQSPLTKELVYVPPALTGIVLATVSGLFGALLITLILFVYPDNRYKFTRTNSYYGRILLGGLIALGVFVLMFSGVAVLAGPNASGSAQNLIAYGGIGILSGMFSDQAAGWLSDRSVFKPENVAAAEAAAAAAAEAERAAAEQPA